MFSLENIIYLKKKTNNLQSIDYAYNIRGWLTEINKDQMAAADLGGKLFAYKVKYNQKDGISNPDPALFSNKNVTAKYNGNIAETDWRSVETIGVNPSITPKRYGYAYDALNRLSAGYYQNPDNAYSKENTESLDYDVNGNITDLYRTSIAEYGSTTATLIDKLKYDYNGNQATNINDYSYNQTGYEGGGQLIKYDLNGNMTEMPDKGMDIKYNHLNLSNFLHLNRGGVEDITINTKYRADGTKLRKENTTIVSGFSGSTTSKTMVDYLDGFQYSKTESPNTGGGGSSEMFSARAMQPQTFSPEQSGSEKGAPKTADLQFLPTAEGFYDYINDQYIYQYKDHLGNVRVSFARNSAGGLQLKDNNDYYPFGMNHLKTGNSYFGAGSYVKYKFNGVELQETGLYTMDWRNYQADVARFSGVDQLSESYDGFSPYHFAMNNPISYSDPSGMYSTDHNGNYSTTNTAEISKLQSYFGSGGSVDGVGSFISENDVFKENIQEVVVNVTGKGNKDTWNLGGNYLFNSYTLYNGILKGLNNWNFQTKAGAMSESLVGMKNDGGVIMMDSMWDALGIVIANNISSENRTAMLGLGSFGYYSI